MKIILLLAFFCITSFVNSQSVWAQSVWAPTGLNSGRVSAMTTDSSGNILASRWAVGIYRSVNNGSTWQSAGLNGKRVFELAVSPEGNIFAMATNTSGFEIFRSTDNAASWSLSFTFSQPNNSMSGGGFQFHNGKIYAVNSVTIGPTLGDIGAYLFISADNGLTWQNKGFVGLGPIVNRFPAGIVSDILFDDGNKLFAGTSDRTLIYTTDDGDNWFDAVVPISAYVRGLEKDDKGNIYCGLAGDGNNLWVSGNNGVSWELNQLTLPYWDLISDIHFSKERNTLYIATDFNLFSSSDSGTTFDTIMNGFPMNASVLDLTNSRNDVILAGTLANGIYSLGVISGVNNNQSIAGGFILKQNYPNPFNPETTIEFYAPERSFARIKVYDITGKEIKVLFENTVNAGSNIVSWDASGAPSGIYFYTLEYNEYTLTKKMILIK